MRSRTGRIVNNTGRPVQIRLNSGEARYLAPRGSVEVQAAEVQRNRDIDKLVSQHIVSVELDAPGETTRAGKRKRSRAAKTNQDEPRPGSPGSSSPEGQR